MQPLMLFLRLVHIIAGNFEIHAGNWHTRRCRNLYGPGAGVSIQLRPFAL